MTASSETAIRPPEFEFIRRADWSNEGNYPRHDLLDASAWSWEFLRRSREYADDYQKWKDAFANVPAWPFDDMPLTHYLCDPQPSDPDMRYSAYSQAHPNHHVLSVKDHIRLRWGIHALPDPSLPWEAVYRANKEKSFDDDNSKLKWLFTGSTVEVIRPPSIALDDPVRPTFVTAACGTNEVLVRLKLGGTPAEYGRSLTRELAKYFVGGDRYGELRMQVYGDVGVEAIAHPEDGRPVTPIYIDPNAENWRDSDSPVIEFRVSGWNKLDVRQATLPHILRMADLLADFERGQLFLQTQNRKEKKASAPIEPMIGWKKLSRSLMKHFALGNFFKDTDAGPNDARAVVKWLYDAKELVCNDEYLRLSRADFKDEQSSKSSQNRTRPANTFRKINQGSIPP